jgi:hypothetical protein
MASEDEVRLIIKAATEQAVANLTKLNEKLEDTGKRTSGMDKALTSLKSSWVTTTAVVGAAAVSFYKFAQAGMESEQVELRLAAAMKNAGTYSQARLTHLKNYAAELQKQTTYEDEEIMTMQRLYTQYGLEGDALDTLTKATLDFANAKGMDLASAADLVGKAINGSTDSVRGLSVNLKDMTSKAERANAVANEMSSIFGGSAAAAADTAAGRFKQAQIALGDVAETIGAATLPAIKMIAEAVKSAADWFNGLSGNSQTLIIAIVGVGVAIAVLTKLVMAFGIAFSAAIWPITAIVAAIALVVLAVKNWDVVTRYAAKAWDVIVNAARYCWGVIKIVFLELARGAVQTAADLVKPYIWAFNKMIEGFNYVSGSHKELIGNIIQDGADKLSARIEQEQAELDQIKILREDNLANVQENDALKEEQQQVHRDNMDNINQKAEETDLQRLTKTLQKKYEVAGKTYRNLYKLDTDYLAFKLKGYGFDSANYQTYQSFILANADKSSKWQFRLWQAMSIQETIINTYKAAVGAFSAMASIPYVGPALGAAAAAAAVAMGMGMVAKIASTKPGNAEEGGFVRGGPGNGTLTYVGENNKNEAIIPLDDPEAQEKMGGLGQRVTVNFQVEYLVGDSALPDKVAREVDKALYKLKQQNMSRAFA